MNKNQKKRQKRCKKLRKSEINIEKKCERKIQKCRREKKLIFTTWSWEYCCPFIWFRLYTGSRVEYFKVRYVHEAIRLPGVAGVQADLGVRPDVLTLTEGLEALTVDWAHQDLAWQQLEGGETERSDELHFFFTSSLARWVERSPFPPQDWWTPKLLPGCYINSCPLHPKT